MKNYVPFITILFLILLCQYDFKLMNWKNVKLQILLIKMII